jgi:hypothetical protein
MARLIRITLIVVVQFRPDLPVHFGADLVVHFGLDYADAQGNLEHL